MPAEEPNTTLGRHPTLRPLPNAPVEEDIESEWDEADANTEARAQEQIYQDIEAAVEGTASSRPGNNSDLLDSELENLHRYNLCATTLNPTGVDRFPSSALTMNQNNKGTSYAFDDDSDPVAAAGLEAMRLVEEGEARQIAGAFTTYDSTVDRDDESNIKGLFFIPFYSADSNSVDQGSESVSDASTTSSSATSSSRDKPRREMLSEDQLTKLWWQAFKKFHETDSYRSEYLHGTLEAELGLEIDANRITDPHWSLLTLQRLKSLRTSEHFILSIAIAQARRPNVTKIVETVSKTLGLESATLAWSCVVCFLKVFKTPVLHL
jgi:hypothetical protein